MRHYPERSLDWSVIITRTGARLLLGLETLDTLPDLSTAALGKPSRKKSAVFLNIVQTGEGEGGVKPMFKNYVVNLVCSGGHLKT